MGRGSKCSEKQSEKMEVRELKGKLLTTRQETGVNPLDMSLVHRISSLILLFAITGSFIHFSILYSNQPDPDLLKGFQKSKEQYGVFGLFFLYTLQLLGLLALPQSIFNFLGFIIYNSFPSSPKYKHSPHLSPHLCFRVVTRGDYPELVKNNLDRNINICISAGIDNFEFEVVTDKFIGIFPTPRKREIVIPSDYQTRSGALYKSRALQYCLEENVNRLQDDDWVVHLDEETLLTEASVKGIVNFTVDGKHHFGQGLITYANEEVVNYFLTLCDTVRVAEDMGKIQFQLRALHMPILGWKGSFVVSKLGSEKAVSFDNGPDGSVAEDTYFGILAASKGYSFDFIHGEMWEKSPFKLMDFLCQRKRWLQGLLLVVHSNKIPLRYRIPLMISVYSWVTMPLITAFGFFKPFFPIAVPVFLEACIAFIGGMWMYLYIYGTIRSFNVRRYGIVRFVLFLLAGVLVTPFKICVETVAVIWGLFTPKHKFFIVQKELASVETV